MVRLLSGSSSLGLQGTECIHVYSILRREWVSKSEQIKIGDLLHDLVLKSSECFLPLSIVRRHANTTETHQTIRLILHPRSLALRSPMHASADRVLGISCVPGEDVSRERKKREVRVMRSCSVHPRLCHRLFRNTEPRAFGSSR